MVRIGSCKELFRLLEDFNYEEVGFEKIEEDGPFTGYYMHRRHRADLYVRVDGKTFESEVYTWDSTKGEPANRKGVFNIYNKEELLFLLTHVLNQLRIERALLNQCKKKMGYNPANVVPDRMPQTS